MGKSVCHARSDGSHELDARMNFMIYGNYRSVVLTLMYIYYSVSTYTHTHTHARAPHAHIHTLTRQRLPIERPDFSDIVTRVTVISDLRNGSREGGGEEPNPEDSLITPQPSCRLSFHEPGRRSASPPAFGGPISPSPLLISEHKASTTPLVSGHKPPSPPRMLGVNSSSPLTLSVAHKSVGFKPVTGQETAV